jgi:hypothetical protein
MTCLCRRGISCLINPNYYTAGKIKRDEMIEEVSSFKFGLSVLAKKNGLSNAVGLPNALH